MSERLRNPHPGDILREDFLEPLGLTAYRLSKGTGLSETRLSQILNRKRGITAETALRLSAFWGTTPEFWMNLQARYDLEEARLKWAYQVAAIQRHEWSEADLVGEHAVANSGNAAA